VVSVVECLTRLGGVSTRATLIGLTSRAEVDRALTTRDLVALARGRYALPTAAEALKEAHRLAGTVSHFSAALHWGWEVKTPPERPHVTLPRNRKLSSGRAPGVAVHRSDLGGEDVDGLVTSPERTLIDCLRDGEWDEALAVADSALRHGFPLERLRALARDARGPGSRQIRRVSREATPEAANPFESALRAIALDVAGLSVCPQRPIRGKHFLGRPDLVDEDLRIILEADSFEWHGRRSALRADARRYNAFVINGWLVLRFAWEDVMFDGLYVRAILESVVVGRTNCCFCTCGAA
jgi:very-short-patch-repair endonuclease